MGTFSDAKVGDWVYTKGRFRHSRNLWQIAKVTKARIYRFANDPPHLGISRSKDFAAGDARFATPEEVAAHRTKITNERARREVDEARRRCPEFVTASRLLSMTGDEVVAKLGVSRMATLASWLE